MFIGVMTTIGSVKPLSQPRTPLRLMVLYQTSAVVTSAHASVVLRSAVVLLRKPVMPISEPQTEDRNSTPIYGAKPMLCSPMVELTIL